MMSMKIAKEYLEHRKRLEPLGYEVIGITHDKESDIILIKERK
ncbi:hypothetical protein LCGC14_2122380 [marine sediment metagenome]|uniref:Uncharacterized protein n=2 Tax=marine sediment metagenome TaxID=412755 RepID=A0A0F9H024_9ZZZZ